jgi:hypothetical protein
MTRRKLLLAAVAAVLVTAVTAGGGALLAAPGEAGPRAPVPRVCWFSDYANAKLSNKCTWDGDERRWYMEDEEGRRVPADTQKLPVANLCQYFHGKECPRR